MTHIDACLGGFLEHLEETGLAANTAVVLLAPRGIALGEHGPVGPFDELVYGELVQTPCMLRLPGGRGRLRRSQALVQSSDWYHTLAELVSGRQVEADSPLTPTPRSVLPLVDDATAAWRDRAIVLGTPSNGSGRREVGLRTPAWYLRRGAVAGSAADATTTEDPGSRRAFRQARRRVGSQRRRRPMSRRRRHVARAEAELRAAVAESRLCGPPARTAFARPRVVSAAGMAGTSQEYGLPATVAGIGGLSPRTAITFAARRRRQEAGGSYLRHSTLFAMTDTDVRRCCSSC